MWDKWGDQEVGRNEKQFKLRGCDVSDDVAEIILPLPLLQWNVASFSLVTQPLVYLTSFSHLNGSATELWRSSICGSLKEKHEEASLEEFPPENLFRSFVGGVEGSLRMHLLGVSLWNLFLKEREGNSVLKVSVKCEMLRHAKHISFRKMKKRRLLETWVVLCDKVVKKKQLHVGGMNVNQKDEELFRQLSLFFSFFSVFEKWEIWKCEFFVSYLRFKFVFVCVVFSQEILYFDMFEKDWRDEKVKM